MGQIKATARRQGKAFTVGGRMRPLPHIASANRDEQAKAERQVVASPISPMYLPCISPCVPLYLPMPPHTYQVVNSTIQGSAADVMKTPCCAAAPSSTGGGCLRCSSHRPCLG